MTKDSLELLSKKMDRIKVLMDATGESIEQMLANYASDDEYPKFLCKDCPIKDRCNTIVEHNTCYDVWLKFLEASDEEA